MGLDNIPHEYPCYRAGTAVLSDEGKIECGATRAADRCPWQTEAERKGSPVYGIMGVPCWYRGKAGNFMLDILTEGGYKLPDAIDQGFYGYDDTNPALSPEYCVELAEWMEDHAEPYAKCIATTGGDVPTEMEAYRYAAWWLRWIAEAGGGSDVWW